MHLIKNSDRYSNFEEKIIKGRYLDLSTNSKFFLFIWSMMTAKIEGLWILS